MPKVRGRYDAAGVLTFHDGEGTDILDVQPDGEVDVKTAGKLKIAGTTVDATAAEINRAADVSARIVNLAAATLSLTEAAHDGKVVTVNRAAGSTLTLPAATGSGARFRIVIGTTLTSGSLVLQVANASDVMQGIVMQMSDDPATVKAFQAAATSDTITLNRTTTGVGSKGEYLEAIDVATNLWQVYGVTTATGTEATPFSAAV